MDYPLEPAQQAILDEKNKLVSMYNDVKKGKLDRAVFAKAQAAFEKKVGGSDKKAVVGDSNEKSASVNTLVVNPEYSANAVSRNIWSLLQQPQVNSYYCGPAAVSSILKSKNANIDQYTAAAYMHTTTNGTDWYNGTYPVRDALNYYLNTGYYAPYGTSVTAAQFESDVTYDIDNGWGIAGDAYEVVGGPHLVGHPNANIFHWFAIDGYDDWGASTHYADSVSGATSISWYANVPAYSQMSTNTVAVIVDGRGIIW